MTNKKVLAVIPARFESSRFPGKLLSMLRGETVIYRVVNQVLKCKFIDALVLVTDDDRIATEVSELPIEIILKRDDFRNGTERVASVISDYPDHEIVVNIQGDEPLLDPTGLENLINLLSENSDIDIASLRTLVRSSDVSKHVVKVAVDEENYALNFTRDLPLHSSVYEHIGVYGFQRDILREVVQLPQTERELKCKLEQLRWLDNKYKIKMITVDHSALSIDVPSDLQKAAELIDSTLSKSQNSK